jgi:hypothetical protein
MSVEQLIKRCFSLPFSIGEIMATMKAEAMYAKILKVCSHELPITTFGKLETQNKKCK